MDNVTHTLFALTIARTRLGRAGRGTTAALVLASNAPDIDIVAASSGALSYLRWHRGPTHGLLGVVGLGMLVAAAVWASRRWWDRPDRSPGQPTASFGMLAAVSMLGVTLHILMDLPTSYGTRLLSPFDWHWYGVDWMPIIDVYLLTALGIGLALGRRSEAARNRTAAMILVFMAANYGVRAASHQQALDLAPRFYGTLLPRSCDPQTATAVTLARWPKTADETAASAGRCLVEVAAIPTFASPFRWRIIAVMPETYEVHDIDLLAGDLSNPETDRLAFWGASLRYPNRWTKSVFTASSTSVGQTFLGFARFPAARASVDSEGFATVRWSDMRFAGGTLALDQPAARQGNLFTAVVRLAPDGSVLQERFGP